MKAPTNNTVAASLSHAELDELVTWSAQIVADSGGHRLIVSSWPTAAGQSTRPPARVEVRDVASGETWEEALLEVVEGMGGRTVVSIRLAMVINARLIGGP